MVTAARPYVAVYTTRFALLLQYRTAALAGFATQCFWGVMKILVLAAFYGAAPHQPLTLAQAVTYVWLGQAFLAILPWNSDPEIVQMVETGNVGYELLRPIKTYGYWFARALALRTAPTILRAVPMFGLAAIALPLIGLSVWGWRLPPAASATILFLASMALAVLLASAMSVLTSVGIAAARTGRAVNVSNALVTGLSGMAVPLALLPGSLQTFLLLQPFAGLVDIPYRIYFGNLVGYRALEALGIQAMWGLTIVLLGQALMTRVMSRIDMQGG
jgi:ABC-2 type transport system permease protein